MSPIQKFGLYWHTLRFLKPVQIYGRILHRIRHPQPDLGDAPVLRVASGPWTPPARRRPSLTGPEDFNFLNEAGSLPSDGWDNPAREKLWRYNQHYFDDLNAQDHLERCEWHHALVNRWIVENPPGEGSGWEPYPTSLRIVNWVKWAMSGQTLSSEMRHSLAIQSRWLTQNLEHHLLGNHLFANAKALIFAGLFFEGPEAEKWLSIASEILLAELPEQILPDGGQFELTPMYHALAVEDLLDLLNILAAYPLPQHAILTQALKENVPAMLRWLQAMSHPDGRIAFFNDAAFGIAPENSDLLAYANQLGFSSAPLPLGLLHLENSGLVRLSHENATVLADLAEVGPSYLPGHAHADTLSFELSLFEQRVIVNSGTSLYGTGPERTRQRGTAAHSTVLVQNRDSSEVWGGFRVARRAHVSQVATQSIDGTQQAVAAHNGYRRMSGSPEHQRTWKLRSNALSIFDHLTEDVEACAIYHLHPDIKVQLETPQNGQLLFAQGPKINIQTSGHLTVETGTWHPEFGLSQSNQRLILPLSNQKAELHISWS